MTGYAATSGGASARIGDLWLAAAVLSCAVGYVEGARVARRIGAIPALCWAMLLLAAAAVPLLAAAALTPPRYPDSRLRVGRARLRRRDQHVRGIAGLVRGLGAGGTARIGQLNLAQPFLAVGWSALLLGEHITWAVPVTAAVVLSCMAICLHSTPTHGQTAPPAASRSPATYRATRQAHPDHDIP